MKSTFWAEVHVLNTQRVARPAEETNLLSTLEKWCFADDSWKENEVFSSQE